VTLVTVSATRQQIRHGGSTLALNDLNVDPGGIRVRDGIHYARGRFHATVRARVTARLAEDGRTFRGGARGWLVCAPAVLWFYGSFVALLVGPTDPIFVLVGVISLGLATTATLTVVQHDALHQALSRHRWVNWAAAYLASPVGASWRWWTAKHSGGHHAYTNVDDHDGDLDQGGMLRLSSAQAWHPWHSAQHVYAWALYALLGFAIQVAGDRDFIVHGRLKNGKQVATPSARRAAALTFEKLAGILTLTGIAIAVRPTPWLIGIYVLWMAVAGFALASVFAVTHYVETSQFPRVAPDGTIAQEWAVTQVVGSTNIVIRNPVVRWYFGGVDRHIEHHLFPRMAHIHYATISPVVRQTCIEFGLPYHEAPSLRAAYRSHARFLRAAGRRPLTPAAPDAPDARLEAIAA
jgi:linoleoyl-CoA desaturase